MLRRDCGWGAGGREVRHVCRHVFSSSAADLIEFGKLPAGGVPTKIAEVTDLGSSVESSLRIDRYIFQQFSSSSP